MLTQGQTRSSGDVGSSVRFARKRTRRTIYEYAPLVGLVRKIIQLIFLVQGGPRPSKLFFSLCPPGPSVSVWGNPGLPWPIPSRTADAERAVIRTVIGDGKAIRLATVWSQVWREPGGNVTGSSLQLNEPPVSGSNSWHEMPTRLIRCEATSQRERAAAGAVPTFVAACGTDGVELKSR